jgi:mono/diheme cytochrome c family protein
MSWTFTFVVVLLSIFAGWSWRRLQSAGSAAPNSGGPLTAASVPTSTALSPGAVLYHVHCSKCHGPEGRGDAEAMARLRPPPRNFAERPWRFEMTANSIRRIVADGIPGTSMAAHGAALSAAELNVLAKYVLDLAQQLPVVHRALSPEQQQLAALGFDVERQPSPVPSLTVEDDRGGSLSLAELRGSWVLLEFWGVSCEPCRTAMPALQRLSIAGVGEHIKIVPVCADADDAHTAQTVMSRIAPGLTAYVEAAGIGIAQFSVQALPTTWLIDPAGLVRATRVGSIDWNSNAVRETFEVMLSRDLPPKPVWTVADCAGAPSHALYDPDSEHLFVSQISGAGDAKDGMGAISLLDLHGNVVKCQWVAGLDAPKGLARHGKTLWVSDIDRLHRIDMETGKLTACHEVPDAKFLTGVAVDSHGTVYVADMLTSSIHQYRDEKFTVFASGEDLESPAGLLADGDRLVVAAWGLTTDYTTKFPGRFFAIERGGPHALSKPLGNLYGLALDGAGGWIGSDFATGRVLQVTTNAEPRELLKLPKGVGGIEYVPSAKLLIVVELTENRISAYDLSAVLKPESR